jgi:hypothetical protein
MQSSSASRRKQSIKKIQDIEQRIEIIKQANDKKRKDYATFLESHPIITHNNNIISINNFIMTTMIEHNLFTDDAKHTYWLNGAYTWDSTGYYDIYYAYCEENKRTIKEKVVNIYTNVILPLKKELDKSQYISRIETQHFQVNTSGNFVFDERVNVLFRPTFYSIKVVIDGIKKEQTGGKKTKQNYRGGNEPFEMIDNLVIAQFTFEYYHQDFYHPELITKLKKYFIKQEQHKIHALTDEGKIAFAYLYPTDKNTQYGFDINKERIDGFFATKSNEYKSTFYSSILSHYTEIYPKKTKAHNLFFTETIETIINNILSVYYQPFVEFINKWVLSMFRPYINAFIIEINNILVANHGIRLFIAGGDAMRRYSNDIAFTKDIDVKLYMRNLYHGKSTEEQGEIKMKIIQIVVENIVKLKFCLEDNLSKIFMHNQDKNQYNIAYPYVYKDNENHINYEIHILSKASEKSHQLRTRELRHSDLFPVDLYSIDFRIQIKVKKEGYKDIIYNHDISVLDVIVQDGPEDNFNEKNIQLSRNGIAYASLEFLIDDFLNTYFNDNDTHHSRAMARIASGKYTKDIQRATCMIEHLKKQHNASYVIDDAKCLVIQPVFKEGNIKILIDLVNTYYDPEDEELKKKKQAFINLMNTKILKQEQLNVMDLIIISDIFQKLHINKKFDRVFLKGLLFKYLDDFIRFKTNFFFEDLNAVATSYSTYANKAKQKYYNVYLELFKFLTNPIVSHEKKNKIFFSDVSNQQMIDNINNKVPFGDLIGSGLRLVPDMYNPRQAVVKQFLQGIAKAAKTTKLPSTSKGKASSSSKQKPSSSAKRKASSSSKRKPSMSSSAKGKSKSPSKTPNKRKLEIIAEEPGAKDRKARTVRGGKAAKPMKQNTHKAMNNAKK